MWYVCDGLYAVVYVCVSCFVVHGCTVSRTYLNVYNSVVKVYIDHLKFCVVCINGRRYVCCCACYVVSNECDEPTSVRTVVKLCTLGVLAFRDTHYCEVIYFG